MIPNVTSNCCYIEIRGLNYSLSLYRRNVKFGYFVDRHHESMWCERKRKLDPKMIILVTEKTENWRYKNVLK